MWRLVFGVSWVVMAMGFIYYESIIGPGIIQGFKEDWDIFLVATVVFLLIMTDTREPE